MGKAFYTDGDGNNIQVELPDYALESTQAKILKLMSETSGTKEYRRKNEKLLKEISDYNKDANRTDAERNQRLKDMANTMGEVQKNTKEQAKSSKFDGKRFEILSNGFISLNKVIIGTSIAAFGLLATRAMDLGNDLASLGEFGIGLNQSGQNIISSLSQLNTLGISTADASAQMKNLGSVVQDVGTNKFVAFNMALADSTGRGAKLGLTMADLSEKLGEDLALRQQLGILDRMNVAQEAQRSSEIYQKQLQFTKLLGKSVDEIRDSVKNAMTDNASLILATGEVAAKFGDETAKKFGKDLEIGLSSLSASGASNELVSIITESIANPVALMGDNASSVAAAFSALDGETGSNLMDTFTKLNEVRKTNPAAIGASLSAFENELAKAAGGIQGGGTELNNMLRALGPLGEQLIIDSAKIRVASENRAKAEAEMTPDKKLFNELAEAAITAQNALATISGSASSISNQMLGALAPSIGAVSSAFTDVAETGENKGKSIMTAFTNAANTIGNTINTIFGKMNKDGTTLADTIRDNIIPRIEGFAEWFASGGGQQLINGLTTITDYLSGLATPLLAVIDLFTGGEVNLMNAFDHVDSFSTGLGTAVGAVGLFVAAMKMGSKGVGLLKSAYDFVTPGSGPSKGVAGGAMGNAAGKAAGGGLAAAGAGIGKLGRGIGAGIGGALKGLATGLGAFANPKILAGATILGASITLIGAGIAGASWILGETLPKFATSLESFSEIDGENLVSIAKGISALGLGIAAMGAGSVIGAIGNLAGSAFEGLNKLFGGDSILDKVADFGNANLDVTKITANADALSAYADALTGIGNIDVTKINRVLDTNDRIQMSNISKTLFAGTPTTAMDSPATQQIVAQQAKIQETSSVVNTATPAVPPLLERTLQKQNKSVDETNIQLLSELIELQRRQNKKTDEMITKLGKLA